MLQSPLMYGQPAALGVGCSVGFVKVINIVYMYILIYINAGDRLALAFLCESGTENATS